MRTIKVLITGIISGLALFGIFSLLLFDTIYGGVIGAILVGMIIGRLTDNNPMRYTIISIFAYNLIAYTITVLFDPNTDILFESEYKMVLGVFVGFMIIMIVFYSIIGSFSAFVTYNMRTDK
jgi:hypothetical protein